MAEADTEREIVLEDDLPDEVVPVESHVGTSFPEIAVAGHVAEIAIGCGGYNYPHWRKSVFYPTTVKQADELKFYSGKFPSVEINNTFHGIPKEETFRRWTSETARHFVFSVKVPQDITHFRRLKDAGDQWRFFYERVSTCLAAKSGPFLVQLPPTLQRDDERLRAFAALIHAGCRVAIEFRHKSWFCDDVIGILRAHDIALVENFTPDNSLISVTIVTATWTYTRLHGSKLEIHKTDFDDAFLAPIVQRAVERRSRGLDQYIYFLNDVDGVATKNALRLNDLILRAIGDQSVTSLVSSWKPVREITKGGPGSIESMFRKAAAKVDVPEDGAKRARLDEASDVEIVEIASTAPPAAHTSSPARILLTPPRPAASPKKGTLLSFFAPQDKPS